MTKKELTAKDEKWIRECFFKNPVHSCPRCGHMAISGGGFSGVIKGMQHTSHCPNCNLLWVESFQLVLVDVQFYEAEQEEPK